MSIDIAVRKAQAWLDEYPGVIGVAQGEAQGSEVVMVYVTDPTLVGRLPEEVEGCRVVVNVGDAFTKY